MAGIELPNVQGPSQDTQYILRQLQQITLALNTLAGQLDMGLRLACGQVSKHEVKVKFEAFDKEVRLQEASDRAEKAADYALRETDGESTEG